MIFSFLLCFVASDEEIIDGPVFRRFVLKDGDSIVINGIGMKIFFAVQSYHFTGKLALEITEKSNNYTLQLSKGDRYSFTDANITANFSDSTRSVSLSLYVLSKEDAQWCYPRYTVHSRELTSAIITMTPEQTHASCLFFDFSQSPMISEFQSESSYVISSTGIVNISTWTVLDKMFLFVARDHIGTVKLTTNLTHCDWNDRDVTFTDCRNGDCQSHTLAENHPLESKRDVKIWIWLCSYGLPMFLLLFMTFVMCLPKKGSREYVTARYMNSQRSLSFYT